MWSDKGNITSKLAFRTWNGLIDYCKNFQNPLVELQVSIGDIYYIKSTKNDKSSSRYVLNFFQVVSIFGDRIFYKEIDYGLEEADPALSPDESASFYWIPFRYFYIDEIILEETKLNFLEKCKIFNLRDLSERTTYSWEIYDYEERV